MQRLSNWNNLIIFSWPGQKKVKKRERRLFFLNEFKWWRKRLVFKGSLENCQGFSIPPARNGEWICTGKLFCASLWWHYEASLARRSQTSWGDVDCHKWVEVGGCWACGYSICKHQFLELDASCIREPVQGEKERCDMGHFGAAVF